MRVHHEAGLWIATCPGCTWTTWHRNLSQACDTACSHRCGRTFGPSPIRPDIEIAYTAGGATIRDSWCEPPVDAWL